MTPTKAAEIISDVADALGWGRGAIYANGEAIVFLVGDPEYLEYVQWLVHNDAATNKPSKLPSLKVIKSSPPDTP